MTVTKIPGAGVPSLPSRPQCQKNGATMAQVNRFEASEIRCQEMYHRWRQGALNVFFFSPRVWGFGAGGCMLGLQVWGGLGGGAGGVLGSYGHGATHEMSHGNQENSLLARCGNFDRGSCWRCFLRMVHLVAPSHPVP